MRISSLTCLLVISSSFAAPILSNRGFFGNIGTAIQGAAQEVGNLVKSNATLSGVVGAVAQSIQNPQLTLARVKVVKGLSDTQSSLDKIASQANATGNAGVTPLVGAAQQGLSAAHDGINRIGDALVSGTTPSRSDQKAVAVGIKDARTAVNAMSAAITKPDGTLSSDIDGAVNNIATLQQGGQDVLTASNLTFADIGLPDNFATS